MHGWRAGQCNMLGKTGRFRTQALPYATPFRLEVT